MCVNAVLYELTVMPLNALLAVGKRFVFRTPTLTQKIDLLRISILCASVTIFNAYVDFSVLYHYLRAQSLLKLYFLYNMVRNIYDFR